MYAFVSRMAALTNALAGVLVLLLVTSFPAKKPRTLGYGANSSTTLAYRAKLLVLQAGFVRSMEVSVPGADKSEMM